MSGEAGCIVCSRARAVVAIVPIAKGYALKTYECACCHSTLQLVTRVSKASLVKQQVNILAQVEQQLRPPVRRVQQAFAN
ncbi:hypothetical protein [Bradyrhizobium sp. CB1015]|uniref:hypothetical protein n=1 Tax=Bradyrhizobium sp. CB1015 TaxID=2976822 RepID=UPI0021AAF35E|nr:hypothetical protein [Bradyrhizobium sp. CB1015]UWU90470.1 hypothetical protein N2604_28955 [Bradyrhizobium sp. CB1015]